MKDSYTQKLSFRAKQRAKLLIARPDFQQEILNLRRKFNIPPQGFQDQRKNEEWHHNFYQSDDIYFETVWPKRSPEIGKLRKAKKFTEAENLEKQLNDQAPVNALRISIKNILIKYKLPLSWKESIRRYLLFNDIDKMWLHSGIIIHGIRDKDTGKDRLYVEIGDGTTLEDIKQYWKFVKFHQQKLHSYINKKFQPIRMLERDQDAYKLRLAGTTYSGIADILSGKYDKTYSYDDVASFIKRHKQRIGIN